MSKEITVNIPTKIIVEGENDEYCGECAGRSFTDAACWAFPPVECLEGKVIGEKTFYLRCPDCLAAEKSHAEQENIVRGLEANIVVLERVIYELAKMYHRACHKQDSNDLPSPDDIIESVFLKVGDSR